jgi:DNA polymerase-3 subunit epsilon
MIATKEYNLRVAAFITNNSFENQNMVIVEKEELSMSAVLY